MAKTVEELEKETSERFSSIEKSLLKVVDLITDKKAEIAKPPEVKKTVMEVAAEPVSEYKEPVHPEWVKDAEEKIGEKLDHCEVDYPSTGLPRYTVVIKNEFSNAPKGVLQYYKVDRRTVVVENGIDSVKKFNTLVAQNLKMIPRPI